MIAKIKPEQPQVDNKIQRLNTRNGINSKLYGLVISEPCGNEIRVKNAPTKVRICSLNMEALCRKK